MDEDFYDCIGCLKDFGRFCIDKWSGEYNKCYDEYDDKIRCADFWEDEYLDMPACLTTYPEPAMQLELYPNNNYQKNTENVYVWVTVDWIRLSPDRPGDKLVLEIKNSFNYALNLTLPYQDEKAHFYNVLSSEDIEKQTYLVIPSGATKKLWYVEQYGS